MAAKRGRKSEMSEENKALLAAVQKVVSIQKGTGLNERQTHCKFENGYVVATNDVMIFGVPVIGMSADCCPHSKTLVAALERCTGEITFVLDGAVLTVKSGRIRVPVPCLDPVALSDLIPDQAQGDAGPALAAALGQAGSIVEESGDNRPMTRAVFMGPGTVEAFHHGHAAIQIWHGVAPLPNIALPKDSALTVAKNASPLVKLGCSNGTATFWFEDTSWVRTSLYDIGRPMFDKLLDCPLNEVYKPVDAEFFDAVKTILPFCKTALDGSSVEAVTFEDDKVWAGKHAHDDVASIDYPSSPITKAIINGHYLMLFEKLAASVLFDEYSHKLFIQGPNMRAVVMGMR